jgi:hypothetical protein
MRTLKQRFDLSGKNALMLRSGGGGLRMAVAPGEHGSMPMVHE